ncbi:hypothetical protein HYQ45_007594 [Verticillium longisporum]|uniref:Gag protein n=2 Tax=Verticillium TaxID=1036719 RepID=A0AA45ARS5_VERDA|nr:hypothetical protein HYQ45_007594 [Verticillium longisporum]PNH26344.1 hypothetical protein BJF96_g10341 [Verticillium dahliae]PNH26926.1 hypothetical protein BJF96_g9757 [Verticillium dahliae]PNH26950.1 hypothetical protein BJF96_g9767 [Verticillium dahliae]PNH28543.1 hypothetical protein BJF96_g8141 [Verticillium dahliae]
MPNDPTAKALLRTFEDWGRWDEEFQTKATSLHQWEYIDPDSEQSLLEKPQRPEFSKYGRRVPPRSTDSDSSTGVRGRRSGQSSQTIRQQSSEPIVSLPETFDPHQRARSIAELTAEDKVSFQFEWRVYEQDYKEYKEQETNCEKLKAWVIDTVDYGLRQSSCRPQWDLRRWYLNLKTSVGTTDREQQTAARRKYQEATSILTKAPKDFADWITTWEIATNHALVWKTGGVEDPNTWFDDLTKAIRPILGHWVTIYRGIYKDKLEDKTLSIGEVAKDLRTEAEQQNLLHPQEKRPKIVRGSFGPTFAGESSVGSGTGIQDENVTSRPQEEERMARKRKAQDTLTTTRRTRAATSNRGDVTCRACDGRHDLGNCYYIFPRKAPEVFRERKVIREAVDSRLRTDKSLKDDVNRLKKVNQLEEAE